MMSKELGGGPKLDLPHELLEVLPTDPFEQLHVARKITSIALSTRVSALESEASVLRQDVADKDAIISSLESQIESLDASLNEASDKLAQVQQEKESLMKENVQLSGTVKKLNRDVTKLEAFRKTLMRSLQDEEDNPASAPKAAAKYDSSNQEDDALSLPSRTASTHSQFSDHASNLYSDDTESETVRPRVSQGLLLASQTSGTPRFTPPGSPPSLYSSLSSMSSSKYSSISGLDSGSQTGRTRVDGKEFFRQVRTRLSYEQFGAFLANVKELNSHKQTKEDTLRKADEIFGPDNKDLYLVFEGLITRNIN
ncbi:uncharacterized protein At4g15545-like [Primulina huaijiensis]|uniref:uncharacterized protein At4g15545-like n=1 Tax=Primulina huaijiensis TaxID=1492673 RepID=UPI003CC76343